MNKLKIKQKQSNFKKLINKIKLKKNMKQRLNLKEITKKNFK